MAIHPAQTTTVVQPQVADKIRLSRDVSAPASRFAERLDRIAAQEALLRNSSPEELQQAAESLRLSALRSSLSMLADDDGGGSGNGNEIIPSLPGMPQIPATVQAYLANLVPEKGPVVRKPEQLVEEPGPVPVALMEKKQAVREVKQPENLEQVIDKASRRFGVDRELIRAVIKAESNFNPRAVSHAGAQGLMQLMPATARGLGVTDSFDPEQNVMGGTRFLKSLLDRYNGDLDSALAAYNWGPGNVDRKPDRLPRETREYLVKVRQYYNSYIG